MEESWKVVEINKEKIALLSPSGQWIELTETKERRITARIGGLELKPMHEVKFSDQLYSKLDQLSAQNPESASDKDDDL